VLPFPRLSRLLVSQTSVMTLTLSPLPFPSLFPLISHSVDSLRASKLCQSSTVATKSPRCSPFFNASSSPLIIQCPCTARRRSGYVIFACMILLLKVDEYSSFRRRSTHSDCVIFYSLLVSQCLMGRS
ncbi:hypothetical protein PENTCL1PPCAC_5822, partial [Pristionchus entomophagus]